MGVGEVVIQFGPCESHLVIFDESEDLSSPSHSNPTSGCISRESHPEVHCGTQGRIISKRKRKPEERGSSPTPTPTQGSRKQFLLPQEETELSKSRPWSSSGQVQVQRSSREPGYRTLSPVPTPTLCHMGLCCLAPGRSWKCLHSLVWPPVPLFHGLRENMPWQPLQNVGPVGQTWNQARRIHNKPSGAQTPTGLWARNQYLVLEAMEPWACVTQRHSSGQWADAGKEQGLGSALEGRARAVVSGEEGSPGRWTLPGPPELSPGPQRFTDQNNSNWTFWDGKLGRGDQAWSRGLLPLNWVLGMKINDTAQSLREPGAPSGTVDPEEPKVCSSFEPKLPW